MNTGGNTARNYTHKLHNLHSCILHTPNQTTVFETPSKTDSQTDLQTVRARKIPLAWHNDSDRAQSSLETFSPHPPLPFHPIDRTAHLPGPQQVRQMVPGKGVHLSVGSRLPHKKAKRQTRSLRTSNRSILLALSTLKATVCSKTLAPTHQQAKARFQSGPKSVVRL